MAVEKRKALTASQKASILQENPDCYLCGGVFLPGDLIEWDHVIARGLGGKQRPEDFRPAHRDCHLDKTKQDVSAIAKAKRIEAKRKGTKKKPKRKIPSRPMRRRSTDG